MFDLDLLKSLCWYEAACSFFPFLHQITITDSTDPGCQCLPPCSPLLAAYCSSDCWVVHWHWSHLTRLWLWGNVHRNIRRVIPVPGCHTGCCHERWGGRVQRNVRSSETIWSMAVWADEVMCYPVLPSQFSMTVKYNDSNCTPSRN